MKKKNIILMSIFIVLVLITGFVGILVGSVFYDKLPFYSEKNSDKENVSSSDRIAVVNLDEGVNLNGKNVKYFEKLVEFPSEKFDYSSLDDARVGIENGKYGAYVVIPSTFSESVESINTDFVAADFIYEISGVITDSDRCKVLTNMMVFTQNLNKNLSYIYVDNILQEFHTGQDNAFIVMDNDLTDKQIIDDIKPENLTQTVSIPELKHVENETEMLDISEYMDDNSNLIATLGEKYRKAAEENSIQIQQLTAEGDKVVSDLSLLLAENSAVDIGKDEQNNDIFLQAQEKLKEQFDKEENDRKSINSETKQEVDASEKYLNEAVKILKGSQYTYEDEHGSSQTIPASEYKVTIKVKKQGASGNNPDDYEDKEVLLLELLEGREESGEHVKGLIENLHERSEKLGNDKGMLYREDSEKIVDDYYFGTIQGNVERVKDEFVQRNEKEADTLAGYREKLAAYKNVDDSGYVNEAIGGLSQNNAQLYSAVIENTTRYMTYANDVYTATEDNTRLLIENIRKANEESNKKVEDGVAQAKLVKSQTSALNQSLMEAFTKKLPGTRLGSLAYSESYKFIVNPIRMGEDSELIAQSETQTKAMEKIVYEADMTVMIIVLVAVVFTIASVSIYSISITKIGGKQDE